MTFILGLALSALAAGTGDQPKAGAWIGPIQLCEDTVAEAVIEEGELIPEPTLRLVLHDEAAQAFAELTTDMLGETLPVLLDGDILMEPVVHEPILAGSLQIKGPDMDALERARSAMQAPCKPIAPAGHS